MAQKCCYCISLRIGTIIISLVVFIASIIGAYSSFAYVDTTTQFTTGLGYVNGIWHVIKGIICIGGLYGAITKNGKLVHLLAMVVTVTAMIHLVFGTGLIVLGIKNQDGLVDLCLQGNLTQIIFPISKNSTTLTETYCESTVNLYLAIFITITIIAVILTFYFAAIAYRYRDELEEQQKEKLKSEDRLSSDHPPRGISTGV
ncbi:hypothetical protein Glove_402g25 [Diversispora epigaea]|uniref:MARVEL domain-containing protein n=1 Tax=Diversispora epigaea TaxID=1348612 RepID=A0A397H3W8_9GLOM|nr:hypothetical protein Glove_402g25 [Diversispora epigaea]